jgi:hypothetical protein
MVFCPTDALTYTSMYIVTFYFMYSNSMHIYLYGSQEDITNNESPSSWVFLTKIGVVQKFVICAFYYVQGCAV